MVDIMQKLFLINNTFILRKFRFVLNLFLFSLIIISSMRQSLKIKRAFEYINSIDKNLKFLNIEIDHTLCMKNDIVRIISVIFIVITCNLLDYYGLLDNNANFLYVLMWIFDRIPDFVNVIIICSFSIFMNKIKIRFIQINIMLNIITKGKTFISISKTSNINNSMFLNLNKSKFLINFYK